MAASVASAVTAYKFGYIGLPAWRGQTVSLSAPGTAHTGWCWGHFFVFHTGELRGLGLSRWVLVLVDNENSKII